MKFKFIDAEKANFSVTLMCKVLQVSRPGYYAWKKRPPSAKVLRDEDLVEQIKASHELSRQTYGSPRIHADLEAAGECVGINRVARLMRENTISVKPKRAFRCSTTERDPAHQVAPNELDRDFCATASNQKWVTDTTFITTGQGWLYVATILDLYNREVVGWAMGANNDTALTLRALDMALKAHKPPEGLLHHSDRGSTYTAHAYRDRLALGGIKCSMSRKGDCWDNGVAESFFATLKKDLVHREYFFTRRQAAAAIFEYIEVFYNRIRRHSYLGYMTPYEYRLSNTATA